MVHVYYAVIIIILLIGIYIYIYIYKLVNSVATVYTVTVYQLT